MKQTKLAVIGANFMADEHIKAFADIPEVALLGIHSRIRTRAEALAQKLLQSLWHAAKCDVFYEIDGQLKINFADGSKLKLAADRNSLGYKDNIKIAGDDREVSEVEGAARAADGRNLQGKVILQSQLTTLMEKEILADSLCDLPALAASAQQHTIFLNALLEQWNRYMPNKVERLPIT